MPTTETDDNAIALAAIAGDSSRPNTMHPRREGARRSTMVADDPFCIDVVTQLKALRAALAAVEAELLKAHVSHCITAAVAGGDRAAAQEKLDELLRILPRVAAD